MPRAPARAAHTHQPSPSLASTHTRKIHAPSRCRRRRLDPPVPLSRETNPAIPSPPVFLPLSFIIIITYRIVFLALIQSVPVSIIITHPSPSQLNPAILNPTHTRTHAAPRPRLAAAEQTHQEYHTHTHIDCSRASQPNGEKGPRPPCPIPKINNGLVPLPPHPAPLPLLPRERASSELARALCPRESARERRLDKRIETRIYFRNADKRRALSLCLSLHDAALPNSSYPTHLPTPSTTSSSQNHNALTLRARLFFARRTCCKCPHSAVGGCCAKICSRSLRPSLLGLSWLRLLPRGVAARLACSGSFKHTHAPSGVCARMCTSVVWFFMRRLCFALLSVLGA